MSYLINRSIRKQLQIPKQHCKRYLHLLTILQAFTSSAVKWLPVGTSKRKLS